MSAVCRPGRPGAEGGCGQAAGDVAEVTGDTSGENELEGRRERRGWEAAQRTSARPGSSGATFVL